MRVMQQVTVRSDGCVMLGSLVTCDGFARSAPYRVQTHVHHDHMKDFEESKGFQKEIVCSKATYNLLIAEFNADLPYRKRQFRIVENLPNSVQLDGVRIWLYPSGHMVGSAMVVAEYPSGFRCAYTSDFDWPLFSLPTDIDVLVVDATYGDPSLQRRFAKRDAVDALRSVVRELLTRGSVVVTGYRGRLHYAAQVLAGTCQVPFHGTANVTKTFSAYADMLGIDGTRVMPLSRGDVRALRNSTGRHSIIFVEARDSDMLLELGDFQKVILSAFMTPKEDPVLRHANDSVRVALTDHADFSGTISLIKGIQPRKVIADGSRGGNADALARFVRVELGIDASSDVEEKSFSWGG